MAFPMVVHLVNEAGEYVEAQEVDFDVISPEEIVLMAVSVGLMPVGFCHPEDCIMR